MSYVAPAMRTDSIISLESVSAQATGHGEWYRTNERPSEEDIDGRNDSDMYFAKGTRLDSVDVTCISVLVVVRNHGVLLNS